MELLIKIKIWNNKYADGMFNYKNDNNNEFKIKYFNFGLKDKNCFLIKTIDNDIIRINNFREIDSNNSNEILFRIRKSLKNNIYEVINPIIEYKINTREYSDNYLNDKIWYPVKSLSKDIEGNYQNYSLTINDIIKLGKRKYIVNKLHFALEEEKENNKGDNYNKNDNISYISSINKNSKSVFNINIKDTQYIINNKKISLNNEKVNAINEQQFKNSNEKKNFSENEINNHNYNDSKNENIKCYNCLNSDSDRNNPLICLCNCRNYIHYECLKKLLNSKITVIDNFKKTVKTYICENFSCDLCFKPYHLRFRIPEFDKTYELIDLTLPEKTDYICLESFDYIINNKNIKFLHIVQLIEEEITIGRQGYNDIIDNDISISREHTVFKYNKNNRTLFLEDKNGKYGTLVLVRGNIKIKEEKTFFQIGNSYISMELKDN